MTSKPSTFGSKCDISEKFFTKLAKSSIIDNIVQSAEAREQAKMMRNLGTKTKKEAGPLSPARKKQLRHQAVMSYDPDEPDELLEWGENLLRQHGLWDAPR